MIFQTFNCILGKIFLVFKNKGLRHRKNRISDEWSAPLHALVFRWLLSESLIGANPGVGVRPPTSDLHIDSSMYLLNSQDNDRSPSNREGEGEKNIDYARRMELHMKTYENNSGLVTCDGSNVRIISPFNKFNSTYFLPCFRCVIFLNLIQTNCFRRKTTVDAFSIPPKFWGHVTPTPMGLCQWTKRSSPAFSSS